MNTTTPAIANDGADVVALDDIAADNSRTFSHHSSTMIRRYGIVEDLIGGDSEIVADTGNSTAS